MSENDAVLRPEDYVEPTCPLCMDQSDVRAIPQQRVAQKLDEYMSRRDYAGAERHLLYWMEEAKLGRDRRGELFLCNELVGHYRKTANRDGAFRHIERALVLLDELGFTEGVSAGTTLVNAATAYSAFGENERALALFGRARALYESDAVKPQLLGGLYNNMATVCVALGRFAEAFTLYEKAMEQMAQVRGGALEQAVTCLNMADAVAAEQGLEAGEARIAALLDRADALLHDESIPHDGYYAFVCEKCAPGFAHYGWFAAAQECRDAAKEIYERA